MMKRYNARKKIVCLCVIAACTYTLNFIFIPSSERSSYKFIIESIQSVARRYDTTLFLIEPSVLRSIYDGRDAALHTLDIVTFGMVGSYNETWARFFTGLRSRGFSANYSSGIPDSDVIATQSVTTHIIIQHDKYMKPIVHIVVFYRIQHGYMWHSQLVLPERRLTFAKKPGIFRNFTMETHILGGVRVLTPSPVRLFLNGIKESEFIECNSSRAKTFYEKYPTSSNDVLFQREGIQIFAILRKVFTNLGIPFVLSAGSLLGWYRHCDILPYGDVDIDMFPVDYTPKIISALRNEGMFLKHIFGKLNDSYQLAFYSPGNVRLDMFMVYEDGNTFWHPAVVVDTGEKLKYSFPKFTMCWTMLQNILVQIPCNYDKIIRTFYGDNWEILSGTGITSVVVIMLKATVTGRDMNGRK